METKKNSESGVCSSAEETQLNSDPLRASKKKYLSWAFLWNTRRQQTKRGDLLPYPGNDTGFLKNTMSHIPLKDFRPVISVLQRNTIVLPFAASLYAFFKNIEPFENGGFTKLIFFHSIVRPSVCLSAHQFSTRGHGSKYEVPYVLLIQARMWGGVRTESVRLFA